MAAGYANATSGYVKLSAAALPCARWTGKLENKAVPVNNFTSTVQVIVPSYTKLSGTIEGPVNLGSMGITVGGAGVALHLGIDATPTEMTATCQFTSLEFSNDIEGSPTFKAEFESNGTITTNIV